MKIGAHTYIHENSMMVGVVALGVAGAVYCKETAFKLLMMLPVAWRGVRDVGFGFGLFFLNDPDKWKHRIL